MKTSTKTLFLFCLFSAVLNAQTNIFPNDGNVGIGITNPEEKLHISSGNEGDAILKLVADTDNNNEADNAEIKFEQDGGLVQAFIGLEGIANTRASGTLDNALILGSNDSIERLIQLITKGEVQMTVNSIGVGIGISSPEEKLHISSGDAGDAILKLVADTDNNNEADNSGIHFVQDGALVNYFVEIEGDASTKSTGTMANALIMGTEENRDIQFINGDQVQMTVKSTGVGIGTANPDSKFTVKGNIHAEEVKVDLSVPAPDYVFKEGYGLKSLEEVQSYIKENGHLPNIPSAKEMEDNGIELGIMNMKLLEKIEELTLYIIQQKRNVDENKKLKGLVKELMSDKVQREKELEALKNHMLKLGKEMVELRNSILH